MSTPLEGLHVLELADGAVAGYAGKLLADAGAEVSALRTRTTTATDSEDEQHVADDLRAAWLAQSKRTGGVDFARPAGRDFLEALADTADVVLTDLVPSDPAVEAVQARLQAPGRGGVVVFISAFGSTGPWASRPATEFTLQAWCGSIGFRGTPDRPAIAVGGEVGCYLTGAWAAVSALAALRRARAERSVETVDLSQLEAMTLGMQAYEWLHVSLMNLPTVSRSLEVPSIEPTKDGWVGLTVMTPAQWASFAEMIGHPEAASDPDLSHTLGRWDHRYTVAKLIRPWLEARTAEEVVDAANRHRVPVARIGTGASVPTFDHFVARRVFQHGPAGLQPRPFWRMSACDARPFTEPRALSPSAPANSASDAASPPAMPQSERLPLADVRILDLTSFLAGPALTSTLAALGADVIKVESVRHPDGLRLVVGPRLAEPGGWELSWAYQGGNANKRDVTIDLSQERGLDLLNELLGQADVVVENFSPRVIENLGLGWQTVHERNPRAILLRMPAFGLDGPWRDRPGFAQTMEQLTGMAWVTGYPDGPPVLPRGPCDFAAAVHGAFALLAALRYRDAAGEGTLVELPMVEVALNLTGEQVLDHDRHGTVRGRQGNRGGGAPQGLYPCRGDDQWIALAVTTDDEWGLLREALGCPAFRDAVLDSSRGRRERQDMLDDELAAYFATRDRDTEVERLAGAGVPVAAVIAPQEVVTNPQLEARGFLEPMRHPVTGENRYAGLPFRLSRGPAHWNRLPPPTLGQHNREVLGGLLGHSAEDLDDLAAAQVIGDRPVLGTR